MAYLDSLGAPTVLVKAVNHPAGGLRDFDCSPKIKQRMSIWATNDQGPMAVMALGPATSEDELETDLENDWKILKLSTRVAKLRSSEPILRPADRLDAAKRAADGSEQGTDPLGLSGFLWNLAINQLSRGEVMTLILVHCECTSLSSESGVPRQALSSFGSSINSLQTSGIFLFFMLGLSWAARLQLNACNCHGWIWRAEVCAALGKRIAEK